MFNNIIIISLVACCVVLAGLFAGSETGLYQLSRLRLRLGVEKKRLSYIILGRCLHDSPGLLLTMLIGTNLSHYLTTSLVTSMFLNRVANEHTAELFAAAVTVPVLFIFSELIPKNMFFYRADFLMPYLSPLFYALHKILSWSGVVPLLKMISNLFARLAGLAASSKTVITSTQRHKIQAFLKDTHEEGILTPTQSDIITRLVSISHVPIRSVMIPIHNVQMVGIDADRTALLNKLKTSSFTRLLVTGTSRGECLGYVNIYETLCSKTFTNLRDFTKPIRKLDAETSVTDAITIMQNEKQRIVLVTRGGRQGREKPIGIATMKDLAEEILGELAEW